MQSDVATTVLMAVVVVVVVVCSETVTVAVWVGKVVWIG